MMARRSRSAAVLAVLWLIGCGGGGDEGPDPIAISFSPGTLTASYEQGGYVSPVSFELSLSRLPEQDFYLYFMIDQQVIDLDQFTLTVVGPNTAWASLQPLCTLEPGIHAGTITAALCLDAFCNSTLPVTGNVLPYSFTVGEGHLLTVTIDGVPVPGFTSRCTSQQISATVGQVVEVVSTVPADWSTSVGTSAGVPAITGPSSTSTTWTGTLSYTGNPVSPGWPYGSVYIYATPVAGSTYTPVVTITLMGG
jgi:hypothetical protein